MSIFFFNDTATTEIYTLSLHDALPICLCKESHCHGARIDARPLHKSWDRASSRLPRRRSEEHTSELQSQSNLVCRLLLEKKTKTQMSHTTTTPASSVPIRSDAARSSII